MASVQRRIALFASLLILTALILPTAPMAATDQEEVVTKSRFTVEELLANPDELPIEEYLKQAKGVLVIPSLIKGGFILGAEGGNGVLMVRGSDGTWSNPAFYTLVAGSLGLQIGGQVSEVIFTLMNDEAVTAILQDEFKFGGDLSVAVGHKGAGVEASSSTAFDADIYAFSKAVGLFGGGAIEGAKLITREEWNQGYYGDGATPEAIVIERRFSNPQSAKLRDALP
jgi:lipid-binding SYLF domain-containing protein